MGYNTAAQTADFLGNTPGSTYVVARYAPEEITALIKVTVLPRQGDIPGADAAEDRDVAPMISAGKNHTVALRSDGTVWTWGSNEYGQLGDNTFIDRAYPVQVADKSVAMVAGQREETLTYFTNAISVAAGDTFTLVLTEDGRVHVLGDLSGATVVQHEVLAEGVEPEECPNWFCDGTKEDLEKDEELKQINHWTPSRQPGVVATPHYNTTNGALDYYEYLGVRYSTEAINEDLNGYLLPDNITPGTLDQMLEEAEDGDDAGFLVVYASTGAVFNVTVVTVPTWVWTGLWRCTKCQLLWDPTSTDPFTCECGQLGTNGDHSSIGCDASQTGIGEVQIAKS